MSRALFVIIFIISGCVTTPSEVSKTLETCEGQLADLPGLENKISIVEKSKQAGGYVLSYGAAAAGYTADAVVFVAEGIVKTVIYCPAYAISAALGHLHFNYCNPKNPNDKVKGSRFGKNIYSGTTEMRKADYVPLSQAIRKISSCFEARGDSISLEKAKSQLVALRTSEVFGQLPDHEKNEINTAIDRLSNAPKR